MSNNEAPRSDPPPAALPRQRRNGFLSVLMVIFGVILLLPGICALVFTGMVGINDMGLTLLWLVSLAISAGGIALIVKAFR